MWLQPAPEEDRMVVSEMGEQWSPNTEPARVADRVTVMMVGVADWQMNTTMGMNSPKVPQAVPMEKDRPAATRKTMAGSSSMGRWLVWTSIR